MTKEPRLLEEEAHSLIAEQKYEEAFPLFKRAAYGYKETANHKQAALCFASAASCWSIKSGEKTFYNSASSYEMAAKEAETSHDLDYASVLYRYAAINYEKDGEFFSFSDCFYRSKECYRRFLTHYLINPRKADVIEDGREARKISFGKGLVLWLVLTASYLVWGHGEKPSRTFYSVLAIIVLTATLHTMGYLTSNGVVFRPNFLQALYLSVVTFTTVGYGDITPIGLTKIVANLEALSGIFIMPLFIISLSRKYLRM